MIPGRSYIGPYMIPGRSWQDHSKEICMICMMPLYGQIMIGLAWKLGPCVLSHAKKRERK